MNKPQEGKIILVDHTEVQADGHGSYLQVFSMSGETYRISEKRNNLWDIFRNARKAEPILLVFEEYKGTQYVADARGITDDLLKRGVQALAHKLVDVSNEERNRSTCLSYAKDLVVAGIVKLDDIYEVATKNYQFIKGVREDEQSLGSDNTKRATPEEV